MSKALSFTDEQGRLWQRYSVEWDGADGRFSTDVWALSFDHAELVLADIKESGRISGRIVEVIDADDKGIGNP